ncbi:hypothetical protein [Micromonospora violae]|uniref:hypothetical protein n=1 Tax=Micromonospora violae TaxID=1278207 RepID=UPI00102BD320|nr:hypothetical protein [Micromonospora violae]
MTTSSPPRGRATAVDDRRRPGRAALSASCSPGGATSPDGGCDPGAMTTSSPPRGRATAVDDRRRPGRAGATSWTRYAQVLLNFWHLL